MTYKGYEATVKFDEDANVFHGEVLNTRDVITFQGTSVKELQQAFKDSVDDYLEFCTEKGKEPDKPFSGVFVVRLSSELHRELYIQSQKENTSINSLVEFLLRRSVGKRPKHDSSVKKVAS